MLYEIAGIVIDIDPVYDMTLSRCAKYAASEGSTADYSISRNSPIYADWLKSNNYEDCDAAEYIFFGEWFYRAAIFRDSFLLHSSAIAVGGKAILFSAPPGTGKSTHTDYWKKAFGDEVTFINDDKPLISLREGSVFVSGTPFSGKHDISANVTVPLGAVCFLFRSRVDRAEEIPQSEGFRLMWLQTIRNINREMTEKMLGNARICAERTRFFKLGCTNTPESAYTARRAILGDI